MRFWIVGGKCGEIFQNQSKLWEIAVDESDPIRATDTDSVSVDRDPIQYMQSQA